MNRSRSFWARCAIAALTVAMIAVCAAADNATLPATAELFERARKQAEPFVVRVETVGGAQPLNRRRAKDTNNEDDRKPNLFRDNPGSNFLLSDGPTTGIVYSADGLILTSSFNFVREPAIVTVTLHDGRQFPATILGRDHVRKLTLLKIAADHLTAATWAPRNQIRVGQWAIALGRGLGDGGSTVSAGIVSALNRMLGNAIQTDANLSPANYGGPLVDVYGQVLGICVPMAQRPGELAGIELYDSGIGFAVPGWRVREIADALGKGQSFYRGWLGMQIDPASKNSVRILQTADPSPLREAGALPGDLIVEINGREIQHYGHLVQALYMIPAGESVHVKLQRGAEYIDVQVTLARGDKLGPLAPVEEPFDPTQPSGESQEPEHEPD